MNNHIDDVSPYYEKCKFLDKILFTLFILNLSLSLINCFVNLNDLFICLNIIVTISYLFLTILRCIYFSEAEDERRKTLIKDSFNVYLTKNQTKNYYTNNSKHSVERLGFDTYESLFYTIRIHSKEMYKKTFEFLFIFILYLSFIILRPNYNFLLLITQIFFSSEIVLDFFKNVYFHIKLKKLDEDFYKTFSLNVTKKNVLIYSLVMNYECLKSRCYILLSSKLFFKMNKDIGLEWEKLLQDINSRLN